jgi:hypothetical protein
MFYAERGHWMVATIGKSCRALNRPPADFNYAPYNGLEIVGRAGGTIAVEVYFWPQAVDPATTYRLILTFTNGQPLKLEAKPAMGDFMLASVVEPELWRRFQDNRDLRATVAGEPKLDLSFDLGEAAWVLDSLQHCVNMLPKE